MRSTSVTAKEPLAVRSLTFSPAAPSAISVTAPVKVPAPMTGKSFVPFIVTVRVVLLVVPCTSVVVVVNVS